MSFLSKNPKHFSSKPKTPSSRGSISRRVKKFPTRKESFTSPHHNPKLKACVNPFQLLSQLIFLSKSRLTKTRSGWEEGLGACHSSRM